jgi:hypothetical protein
MWGFLNRLFFAYFTNKGGIFYVFEICSKKINDRAYYIYANNIYIFCFVQRYVCSK